MAPTVADVFAHSALECRFFFYLCLFLALFIMHKCNAILTYNFRYYWTLAIQPATLNLPVLYHWSYNSLFAPETTTTTPG